MAVLPHLLKLALTLSMWKLELRLVRYLMKMILLFRALTLSMLILLFGRLVPFGTLLVTLVIVLFSVWINLLQ